MKSFGNSSRPLRKRWCLFLLSSFIFECAHDLPREPFLWDDDAPIVRVHRADVVEAEAAVIQYLRERGAFAERNAPCEESLRAYRILTRETAEAYQVLVERNAGLCRPPTEDESPRHRENVVDSGPGEYAVSKKDFHIISVRLRGDKSKPAPAMGESEQRVGDMMDAGHSAEQTTNEDAGPDLPSTGASSDGGVPKDGELLPRWQLNSSRKQRLGRERRDGGVETDGGLRGEERGVNIPTP